MNEHELLTALKTLFPQAEVSEAQGNFFWFVAGDEKKMMPFLTLVTSDEYDTASNLARPGVYRLNIPLSATEYRERFGTPPKPKADWTALNTGHDYTALNYTVLNTLMPHPIYAPMHWACVLNPSAETFETLRPLLQEAYARAAKRQ